MDINKISNRTVLRIIGLVALFVAVIWLGFMVQRQLMWVVISLFFAVALNPVVEALRKKLPGKKRGVAAAIVVFGSFVLFLVGLAALIPSLVSQTASLVSNIPSIVRNLGTSTNPMAQLLQRYDLVTVVQNNQDKIISTLSGMGQPLLAALRGVFGGIIGLLTVLSLTFFMLAEGGDWLAMFRRSRFGERYKHLEPVTTDMYTAVSGYVIGNLATSALAGVAAGILMLILGVPYAIPLAFVVAVFDLLPLVGATLGAIVVLFVCLFQSIPTTVIMLVFFLVYQQFENQILQPMVYSKTVQISPLIVFVAALMGASLAGIIGALLAIPVAASIKIIISYYLRTTRPTTK